MLRPEQADRSRFPSTVLLHGSAVDFGLGQEAEIAIRLGAIYAAVLSFAASLSCTSKVMSGCL